MEQLQRLQSIEREMISEGKSSSEIDAFKATLRRQQNAVTTPQMGGLAVYMQEGGDPAEESFFERFNPLTGSYRRKKPLSVRLLSQALDYTPVGTVKAIDEIYDESQKEDPSLTKMGLMTLAEVAGYVPLAGPPLKKMVRGRLSIAEELAAQNQRSINNKIKNYQLDLENNTTLPDKEIQSRVENFSNNLKRKEEQAVLRNKEMFSEDVYHFSKGSFEGDTFDTSRSTTRFDRLGTHVGTKEAAKDRAKFSLGNMDAEEIISLPEGASGGSTMPLRARVDKPYLKENGEIFSEEEVRLAMNNYADQNKIADLDIAMEAFRKDLTDNGFTHIPYKNNIEGRDRSTGERQISYIMLTNRTAKDPAVLKGRFSKFEDVNDPRLMRADGGEVMDGIGSLNETARGMSRGPRGIGAYQQFADGGPVYMANGGSPVASMIQRPMRISPMRFPTMPPQAPPSNIRGDGMSANDLQRMLSRQAIAPENVADVQSDIQRLQQADVAKRAAALRDEAARRAREGNNPIPEATPQPMPVPTGPFGGSTPQPMPRPNPFPVGNEFPTSQHPVFFPRPENPFGENLSVPEMMPQPMNIMGQPMQQPMQQPQFGGFGIGSLFGQQFGQQQQNTGGLGSPQPTANVLF
jgi:hypothetical protein